MGELRIRFHREMEAIESHVVHLFALVAEDLAAATDAFLGGEREVISKLQERERTIDGLYREIEDLVGRQMALQAPVAADLRFLLSVLRIVPELERSHDLVVHIVRHADYTLVQELTPRTRGLVEEMGELATEMWASVAECWYQRDGRTAAALDERDDDLDAAHAAFAAELAQGVLPAPATMTMTLVGRFYERLGDHAVNVARRVAFLAGSKRAS